MVMILMLLMLGTYQHLFVLQILVQEHLLLLGQFRLLTIKALIIM